MALYIANATNSQDFSVTADNQKIGDLLYEKWYSFSARILMADGSSYQLEPAGFWESKIELKDRNKTLIEFSMGWKGIIIKTLFNGREETFLLKLKGLLSNKFILLDVDKEELLVAETEFKWRKLSFNCNMETTAKFESFDNKEPSLLTILHCVNYYMATMSGT